MDILRQPNGTCYETHKKPYFFHLIFFLIQSVGQVELKFSELIRSLLPPARKASSQKYKFAFTSQQPVSRGDKMLVQFCNSLSTMFHFSMILHKKFLHIYLKMSVGISLFYVAYFPNKIFTYFKIHQKMILSSFEILVEIIKILHVIICAETLQCRAIVLIEWNARNAPY